MYGSELDLELPQFGALIRQYYAAFQGSNEEELGYELELAEGVIASVFKYIDVLGPRLAQRGLGQLL